MQKHKLNWTCRIKFVKTNDANRIMNPNVIVMTIEIQIKNVEYKIYDVKHTVTFM